MITFPPGQQPANTSDFQLDGMAWFIDGTGKYPDARYYWLGKIEPIEDEV